MTTVNNQLVLFTTGTPNGQFGRFLALKDGEKDGKIVRKSVSLAKRKEVAKELGLSVKNDKDAVDREMKRLGIELKGVLGKEVVAMLSDPNFVGTRMSARTDKNGLRSASFTFSEVKRGGVKMSDAEMAELLGFNEDEIREMREEQEKKSRVVELEVTQSAQPEPASETAPATK